MGNFEDYVSCLQREFHANKVAVEIWENSDVQRTLAFMVEAHKGQFRKESNSPYSDHPIRVATAIACHEVGSVSVVKATLTHDVLEDCKFISHKDLFDVIGPIAFKLVLEVTNPPNESKMREGRLLPRDARKAIDRQHIARASISGKIIKLFDRQDNLFEITERGVFAVKYANESLLLLNEIKVGDPLLATQIEEQCHYLLRLNSGLENSDEK